MSVVTTILLVDDEAAITDNLAPLLRRSGYEVQVAGDGRAALRALGVGAAGADARSAVASAAPAPVDLVVLDVLMPGADGRSVLRAARADGLTMPIILLTQVGASVERAMALEEGADDYLNKPFDPHELLARIRAVLRRGAAQQGPALSSAARLRSGEVVLDRGSQRVFRRGKEVTLTPRATVLLAYFMAHPDELMTRERLLESVWGWTFSSSTRSVDTRVAELRRVLEPDAADPELITTVPGVGYRFSASVRGE